VYDRAAVDAIASPRSSEGEEVFEDFGVVCEKRAMDAEPDGAGL